MKSAIPHLEITEHPPSVAFKAVIAVLLALAVWCAHGQSLRGDFVLDDSGSILENTSIRSLSALGTVLRGDSFTTVAGRPLLNLSLAVNYAWGGFHPSGYRIFNYGIHTAVAFVLYCLLQRVFSLFAQTRSASAALALSISLLWSLHPLTTNGVSYIVQRGESMASLCYVAVLWGFVKGVQTSQRRWFVASVFAAWMGSLTKEIIATVPFSVMALDAFVVTRDWRQAFCRHSVVYFSLMTCWIPLAICMSISASREQSVGYGLGVSLQDHLQTQAWAIAHYLQLVVWPDPLVFDYGPEFSVTNPRQIGWAAVVLAFFTLIFGSLAICRSPLVFPGVALGLLLGPTSVIPIVSQTVAEHRMYLGSACMICWIVLALYFSIDRRFGHSTITAKSRCAIAGVVLVSASFLLGGLTFQRSKVFQSADAIWKDTLQKQPRNQRAYLGLAGAEQYAGRGDAALRLYERAISIQGPLTRHIHEVRGSHYVQQGQLELALADFTQAISLNGKIIDDRYHRATILRNLGRFDEAIADLDKARQIDPQRLSTDLILGSVYSARGELQLALDCWNRVLASDPQHVSARRRRLAVYSRLQRWEDAQKEIRCLQQEGQTVDPRLLREVENQLASSSK